MTFYSDGFVRGFHILKIIDRNLVDASFTVNQGEIILAAGVSFSKETPVLVTFNLFTISVFIAFFDKIIPETEDFQNTNERDA